MQDNKNNTSIREIPQVASSKGRSKCSVTQNFMLEFVRAFIHKAGFTNISVPFASGVQVEELIPHALIDSHSVPSNESQKSIQEETGITSAASKNDVDVSMYDLIYSVLPVGFLPQMASEKKIVEDSLDSLTQNGFGIFLLANCGFYGIHTKRWLSALAAKGINLAAIIDMPEGLYLPSTLVSSKIVIFSKIMREKLFLAKAKSDSDAQLIAENFISYTYSLKSEALGTWVDHNTYQDYEIYENEQRRKRTITKLEKAYNGKRMPIAEISFAVNLPRRNDSPFIEAENALYLPKYSNINVVTNMNELQTNPMCCFQILVDQEQILPEFLKFFFNSDSGVSIRMCAATYHFQLNIERIKKMEVPVPSIKTQAAVLGVYAELNKIELEASRLKDRLENVPASFSNIAKEIKNINNNGDKFEQWIESLPYPLATILKRYIASDTYQQKQEMLFYFFEAYSIFIAAILTAVYQQPQFNNSFGIEDVGAAYFEKPSFGAWIKMGRALAKFFRIRMDDSKMIDSILYGFHTDDRSLVNLICLGDVYSILQKTCDYRNSWKGHSGISSEIILADHVRVLEGELFNLQKRLKDLYDKIRLVRPVSLKLQHGEFTNKVEVLTGSNSIFKKDEINGDALDEDRLYIQIMDTGETFDIPPFFVLKNSPDEVKNACYFYNRIEGSQSRYVSYHFEGKPENFEDGKAAFDIIKAVLERTSGN